MDNQNQKGFIDTATSLGQAAYDVTKTIARAAAGDYIGAVVTAVKSPLIRKIVTTVLVIILLFIFIVGSIPTMIWSSIVGGGEYSEVQIQILNMASQINGVFLDDYNIELKELEEMGVSEEDTTTNEPVPPISPYKIMSYFCATLLTPEGTEKDDETTEEGTEEDASSVVAGGIQIGTKPLSDSVLRYRSLVESAAAKYGVSAYVDMIMAMMMQESGGRGEDVMQAAASGYVHGAVTPESSIDGGVHYFSECLKKANCTSPKDWNRLEVAVQSYNYGMGYITWLNKNGYTGWTATNAAAFSDYMINKYHQQGNYISRYGDKQYVSHVFRYYHGSGAGSNSPVDKIDIVHLLSMLRAYEGEYYYHEADGSQYEIIFVTNKNEDFFTKTVFRLTDKQVAAAKSYEQIFEQLGNTEFGDNILGQGSNMDSLPLTDAQVTKYLAIARQADPTLSQQRSQVLAVGLSVVGKIGYFWGGKYHGTGWNPEWGTMKKVTSPGDHTTGTYQPYGLDCSGFVDWAYRTAGVTDKLQAGGTWHQYNTTTPISASQLKPGDLGFMLSGGRTTHVGMFVGFDSSGRRLWVHCQGGTGVVVGTCSFTQFRRVVN